MREWREILAGEIGARGVTDVAADLGYARSSVSLVHHDRYPGDPHKIAARVLQVFASKIKCPHQKSDIAPALCKELRGAPMPTHDPKAFKQWTACQACSQNPETIKRGDKNEY